MNVRGQYTYPEILYQSEAWTATLDEAQRRAASLTPWLRRSWTETLFTGCGSPHYISHSAAVIWRAWTGRPARAFPASELWLAPDLVLPQPGSLLVATSRSGETTETLRAIDRYSAKHGEDWLAITCDAESALGRRAPQVLVTRKAEEQSIAQTRSFSTMLLLTQALAALAGGRSLDSLAALPTHAERLIQEYEPLTQSLAYAPSLQRFTFLGSGVNYGLACEAMLKMKEMSLAPSEAFHTLEFRHGPKSVVGPDMLVVGLVSEATRAPELAVLAEMRDLGATVLALSETSRGVKADYVVELDCGLDDITRVPLLLPVLQLLAYHHAMAKGLDPDRPTNLDAVVKLA